MYQERPKLAALTITLLTGVVLLGVVRQYLTIQRRPSTQHGYPPQLDVLQITAALMDKNVSASLYPQNHSTPKCKIYILDVAKEMPATSNWPPLCNLGHRCIWPFNVAGKGLDGQKRTPHFVAQHAAPFFFHQALMSSSYVTTNESEADLIYVHFYCYMMWWVASRLQQHDPLYTQRDARCLKLFPLHGPEQLLRKILDWVQQQRRWKLSNGRDYVFFLSKPDIISVFDTCSVLTEPFFLASERGYRCVNRPDYQHSLRNRTILVPYLGFAHKTAEFPATADRSILVYFTGGCSANVSRSQGQHMRAKIAGSIQGMRGTHVQCTCSTCKGRSSHLHVMQDLHSSIFCLVMPGDTQASKRLTEVILAGCIPVFPGPPYHTLPLVDFVNYKEFAMFFRFNSSELWQTNGNSPEHHVWKTDIDIQDVVVPLHGPKDMVNTLESIPAAEILQRQKNLARYRQFFQYEETLSNTEPMAADAILQRLCEMQNAERTAASSRAA